MKKFWPPGANCANKMEYYMENSNLLTGVNTILLDSQRGRGHDISGKALDHAS